jgi:hypothetical protein
VTSDSEDVAPLSGVAATSEYGPVMPERIHQEEQPRRELAPETSQVLRPQLQQRTNPWFSMYPTIYRHTHRAARVRAARSRYGESGIEPYVPIHWLFALGGGTGASIGIPGSIVHQSLLQRMQYQDKAVIFLVLMAYMVALCFSASLTYRDASNDSPVTYYSRDHDNVIHGHDLDVCLDAFNQPPKNIMLRVAGFVQVPEDMGTVRWRDESFHVAFTFSLDLSPWIVRETQIISEGPTEENRVLQDGLLSEDRRTLDDYLLRDSNDLSYIEFEKKVAWRDWEELATNIKHKIRQSGFPGVVSVDRIEEDYVQVYKNKPWANFMHSRATRCLSALSICGWMIYVPYMWLRCKRVAVKSHFHVDIGIGDYWPLIADKLSATGFREQSSEP